MIKQHERLILRVCALYANSSRDELGDLYQDAVCAMWEAYPSFKGDSKPSTWIYSVARYTMLNHVRKKDMQLTVVNNDNYEDLTDDDESNDALEEMYSALAYLPDDERDMMIMWLEGFELDEIASTCGLRYGAVATRLTRIKKKLKNHLNKGKG